MTTLPEPNLGEPVLTEQGLLTMKWYRFQALVFKALGGGTEAQRIVGEGSPEGRVEAGLGSTFHRTDGGTSTSFYVKETGGVTSTGWVAK